MNNFQKSLVCAVLLFTGSLMVLAFQWVTGIPYDLVSVAHGSVVGAIFAPTAAIFKFAFDFGSDGKVDS